MTKISETEAIDRALGYARDHAQRLCIFISTARGCSIDVDKPRNLWGSGKTVAESWEAFAKVAAGSASIEASWSAPALQSLFESAIQTVDSVQLIADFRKPKGRAFTAEVRRGGADYRARPSANAETAVAEALDFALAAA